MQKTLLARALALLFCSELARANDTLPEFGQPQKAPHLPALLRPGPNGVSFASDDSDSRFVVATDISRNAGASLGVRGAKAVGDLFALGGGAQFGGQWSEAYLNLGLPLGPRQRLILTGGRLQQKQEYDLPSGDEKVAMTQHSVGASWRYDLRGSLFDHAELNAYANRTPSRDLPDQTWSDGVSLWNDPRRIAGSRLDGFEARLGLLPWDGGRMSLGLGVERLRYDLLTGDETHTRPTASLGLEHTLDRETRLRLGLDGGAAQARATVGIDRRVSNLGTLSASLVNTQGRDHTAGDTRVQLAWMVALDGQKGGFVTAPAGPQPGRGAAAHLAGAWNQGLLDQVALRPTHMPLQIVAKRDTTAAQTLVGPAAKAAPVGMPVHAAPQAKAAAVVVETSAAPEVEYDPATGSFTLGEGVLASKLQVSLDGGSTWIPYSKLLASIKPNKKGIAKLDLADYDSLQVRLKKAGKTPASAVTTIAFADTTPDAFSFTDVTGQTVSTLIESSAITVAGINAAASISVSGGEYQIDSGSWTSSAGTVTVGQTVKVRHTTSASTSATTNTVLTIGGVSDTFSSTTTSSSTTGSDTTPDAFSFTALTNQALSSQLQTIWAESNAITVSGINAPASISIVDGEYQIDGGAWTSVIGTVTNGQTVKVRLGTLPVGSLTASATLNIGGVTGTFDVTTQAADMTPNAFSFTALTNQTANTIVESNSIIVSGIDYPAIIYVSGGGYTAEYQINGGSWTSSAGTVTNGQTVKVRHNTIAPEITIQTTLTIHSVQAIFATTTGSASATDTIPDAFTFTDVTNQALSTVVESAAITVAGINAAASISVSGGEYQINGGSWTSSAGTVTVGQTVKVRHTTSASNSTTTDTTLTIGGVSDSFSTTTLAVVTDTTPDAFVAGYVIDQALSTVAESHSITVQGINAPTPISVTGGEYQINGGSWTSSPGTVTNLQNVRVRHTTSASYLTTTNTTLTIGGVSDTFRSTTVAYAVDTTPDNITFTDLTNQALSTVVESAAITVAGINAAASISVSGGEYQINGGSWTSSAGTVTVGQTVKVRHTTSASNSATTDTTLTIGGVSDTFSTTTLAAATDTTPDAFTFTDVSNQALSTVVESAAITVAGINAAASISVSGGEYQINGGSWTSSAGTVTVGQTVKVRHTTSASNSTTTNTVLTIGGVSDTFSTTTLAAAGDTTAPATPSLAIASGAAYTNSTSVSITITGDTDNVGVTGWFVAESSSAPAAGAGGWVGARPTTASISAGDGAKTLYVWTKDAAGNVSNAGSDGIELGTAAPSSVSFVGTVPDTAGATYSGLILAGDRSFTGASFSVTSTGGGTISGVSVDGSGRIVFNYITPFADPDLLRVQGTDKYGNSFTIDKFVYQPY